MLAQVASVPTVADDDEHGDRERVGPQQPTQRDVLPGARPALPSAAPQASTVIADSTVSAAVQRRHPATRLAIDATTGARMGASSSTVISRAAPAAGPGRRRRRRGAADR